MHSVTSGRRTTPRGGPCQQDLLRWHCCQTAGPEIASTAEQNAPHLSGELAALGRRQAFCGLWVALTGTAAFAIQSLGSQPAIQFMSDCGRSEENRSRRFVTSAGVAQVFDSVFLRGE